jgi:hypothetical protein
MKCKKTNDKPARIATLAAEAMRLAGPISDNQRRIFAVAAKQGKELEPIGVMAGNCTGIHADEAPIQQLDPSQGKSSAPMSE